MKTKPLYIALGMVLGAAVLALIAAAPDPGILHVPGISVVGTNAANIVIATNSIRNPALPNTGIYYSGAFSIFRVASNDIAVVGSSRFGMPYLDTEEGFTLRDSSGNMISRGATGVGALIGSGSPDGVITLPPGSMYLNTSGGSGTTLYLKESGVGNTGWAGVASGGSAVWTTNIDGSIVTVNPTNTVQVGGLSIIANGPFAGVPDAVSSAPTNEIVGWSEATTPQSYHRVGTATVYAEVGYDPTFNDGVNGTGFFARDGIGGYLEMDWGGVQGHGAFGTASFTGFIKAGTYISAGQTNQWILGGVTNGAPHVGVDGTDYPLAALNGDGSLSVGGTLPSYFTNGVQDATLSGSGLVAVTTNRLRDAVAADVTALQTNATLVSLGGLPLTGGTVGNLTVNSNLTVNAQSGFAGFAAGSLPSGVAVGYQTYCTDCLTPWGVGDRVEWDGSNWRTMRARVLATTSTNTYILSCTSNALFIATPITECDLFAIGPNGSAPVQYTCLKRTFTSGGSGSSISAQGNKGDFGDAIGFGHGTAVNGYELAITAGMFFYSNNVVAMGGQYELSNDSDGTDNYIAWVGLNTVTTTNQPPSSIAAFVYDKWNYLGRTGAGPETNHWLCYTSRVGVSNVVDTGITPIFQASGTTTPYTRLSVVALTNTITFYTNGVACLTTSDMTTIPGAGNELYSYVLMYKTAGSLGRTFYEMNPWYHKRRGNYSRIY